MNAKEKYEFLAGTEWCFATHKGKDVSHIDYKKDDFLKIYFKNEQKPSYIQNKEFLKVFDELYNTYKDTELYNIMMDKALEMVRQQMKECVDEAKAIAAKDKRILKVRCVRVEYVDGKKVLEYRSGRSTNCTYIMSELYGMSYNDCYKQCKDTVDRWRSEDTMDWHILDENDNIIY